MKQISSAITTTPKAPHSKTGTLDGEHGLEIQSSSENVANWLARQSVRDMDAAAVSRAQQHGVKLIVAYDSRFPTGPNGENLPSYTVATDCDVVGGEVERKAALQDLLKFQATADMRTIEHWLAELSVITAGRQRDGAEAELMLTAYASRLRSYPADVVKDALLKKTWKFFPTWDELKRHCDAKSGPRRHMIAALQRPIRDPEPVRRAPTQDERDRIQALVDEAFPMRSEKMRQAAVAEVL